MCIKMEDKEKFQVLYQSLVDGNKEYVDFIGKAVGILLIAIGWLIANDDPFPMLTNGTLLNAALVSIVFGVAAITGISFYYFSRSKVRYELLREMHYAEESIFEHYRIPRKMIVPVLFIHNGLFLVIFVLVSDRYGFFRLIG